MRKRRLIFLIAFFLLGISSCHYNPFPAGSREYALLSGECLKSEKLQYIRKESRQEQLIGNAAEGYEFRFDFKLDMSGFCTEELGGNQFLILPSDKTMQSVGSRWQEVKTAFYTCCHQLMESRPSPNTNASTLLYAGGISLVGDKPFAGHPAGENLAPYISFSRWSYLTEDELDLGYLFDYDYLLKARLLQFSIPAGNHKLTDTGVVFDVKVPVKVVKHLHWLNDKLENPGAPVPYEDVVLSCTFSTKYGLE